MVTGCNALARCFLSKPSCVWSAVTCPVVTSADHVSCRIQKQSASLKAYKKWFKALLESSQALVDGRNEAADLDKELKLREKDLQVPLCFAKVLRLWDVEQTDCGLWRKLCQCVHAQVLVSEATAFVDEQRTSRRERRSNRR